MIFTSGSRSEVLGMVVDELAKAKNEGAEGAFVFLPEVGRVNVIFNAAQQSVQLTAFGDQQPALNPLQMSLFAEVSPATIGGR